MANIKMTLSIDPRKRSPSAAEEARWLAEEGAIYYQLSNRPLRAKPGCLIYFVRAGHLVVRARANDSVWMEAEDIGGSYTGVIEGRSGWRVEVIPPMELATRLIPYAGFQGYRQGYRTIDAGIACITCSR